MAPRGRKPKPTALKELEGNPGKRKLNKSEPRFAKAGTEPPEFLDAEARAEWRRVAPQLSAQKMLTVVDRTMLAAYCVCISRWRRAEKIIQDNETLVFETPNGSQQQIPQISVGGKYLEKAIKIATEFGFTPAARSRLNVKPGAGDQDPHDKFFGFSGQEAAGAAESQLH
jgi:P27 family predicted phage terminase small subunit